MGRPSANAWREKVEENGPDWHAISISTSKKELRRGGGGASRVRAVPVDLGAVPVDLGAVPAELGQDQFRTSLDYGCSCQCVFGPV